MNEANQGPHKGSLLAKLWNSHSNTVIEGLLGELSISDSSQPPKGEEYVWKPVGGSLSNAANIHTIEVSIAPIIERITNSYDAAIEVKEYEINKGNPIENELPPCPRKAIERWWDIPKGDTATYSKTISNPERTKLAKSIVEVSLNDSNNESQPTIIIKDTGIGQAPEDFHETLLRLGHSNKISRSHLHGTYGHGGSSSFRYCDYTVILSRRNPVDVSRDSNVIGWTIVRKNRLIQSNFKIYHWADKKVVQIKQPPVYEYLCKADGTIPKVPLSEFPTFMGTYIAHIEYQAREWQNLSRGLGYRLFRNYLFDPVLPFRLADNREDRSTFERNMFGARSTLDGSPVVAYRNESLENLGAEGKLLIRYWMLYNEEKPSDRPLNNYIERVNSRNTIIVTLNGQRHGTLEKSLISKKCRLPRVAETLLVQIMVDDLNKGMIGELNTSDRGQLVQEGYTTELIQQKLVECLQQDVDLFKWEQKLSEIHAADDESTNEVTRILDQLLDIGLDSGLGSTDNQEIPQGVGTTLDYDPPDPPTDITVQLREDPIEIIKGESRKFSLELNAPNSIFRRRINRGIVTCSGELDGVSVILSTNKFKDGRLPVEVKAEHHAEEYVARKINFIFDADNVLFSLETERFLIVLPQSIYEPIDPPTELKFLRSNPIELQIGKANIISLSFNGPNDILTRLDRPASLSLSYEYPHISQVRRRGPNNGKIQFTVKVSDTARIGDSFKIVSHLQLSEESALFDERVCIIVPQKEKSTKKGGVTSKSRPNYKLQRIRKENWGSMNWNEENIGKFEFKKDENQKDCLYLIVNLDSKPLDVERQRRIRRNQSPNTLERIDNKYFAHVAYHLFQQFNHERKSGVYDLSSSPEYDRELAHKSFNPDQYESELNRVANTLVLSFRGITDLSHD